MVRQSKHKILLSLHEAEKKNACCRHCISICISNVLNFCCQRCYCTAYIYMESHDYSSITFSRNVLFSSPSALFLPSCKDSCKVCPPKLVILLPILHSLHSDLLTLKMGFWAAVTFVEILFATNGIFQWWSQLVS